MQLTPAYLPVTYKQWVDLNRTIDRDQWPSREEFLDAIGRILGYKYFSFPSVYEVASSPWSRKLPVVVLY